MQVEESINDIVMERNFPYENMTTDERDFCLRILNNCKEIADSIDKVNGVSKGTIVNCYFSKDVDVIKANGVFFVGTKNSLENRCLEAEIYITDSSIIVDMLVNRILANKQYRVLDKFKLEQDILTRESQYNYTMESIKEKIEDENMKGRLT